MKKRKDIKSRGDDKPDVNLNSTRNNHLEGFSEEEVRMIKLIAEIFVNAVVNHGKI